MGYKKKLIVIILLVVMLTIIQYALPAHSIVVHLYNEYVFHPFQSARNLLFSIIPFSVGDLLYIGVAILTVYVAVRWIYFLVNFRTYRYRLGNSFLRTMIVLGLVYIVFILGWSGNYYKPSLTTYWQLDQSGWKQSSLVEFDSFLVSRLNAYAPGYKETGFKEIDRGASVLYSEYADSRRRNFGVKAKASVFGYLMQYLGIQGYYNPWTGEAQVNRHLPAFMLPFVVCHEMAHQAGIAAEDDANLLSYVLSTKSTDSVFRYSGYFNLWLYTHARLRAQDSARAVSFREQLNPLTIAHLETLKRMRKKYESEISDYSGALYDGYLKLHHQKDGIGSYDKVTITAWAWEQKHSKDVIELP